MEVVNLVSRPANIKSKFDDNLAKPHKKGAKVQVIQMSKHKVWGQFTFNRYNRADIFFQEAKDSYDKSLGLLNKIHEQKVDANIGIRHIDNDDRNKLELNSTKFFVFTKLGLEHMVVEFVMHINQMMKIRGESEKIPLDQNSYDLLDYLSKTLPSKLGVKVTNQDRIVFKYILERRHNIEHPSPDNVFAGMDNDWYKVNLSWVLSEQYEHLQDYLEMFCNKLVKRYVRYVENHRKWEKTNNITTTLTVRRGYKSGDQFKKF